MKPEEYMFACGKKIIAPVLMEYVVWVLKKANAANINKLYFMARDGYILHKIAKKVCEKQGFNIECRYLYCSRKALYIPLYWLMKADAYDYLFAKNARCTLSMILNRTGIPREQWNIVLDELHVAPEEIFRILTAEEIECLRARAQSSRMLEKILIENSRMAYDNAIAYLRQEKLFEGPIVALVDSGWNGTSQCAIKRLLTAEGYKGQVQGYYFGMYSDFPQTSDNRAEAWYFTKKKRFMNKVFFSPNLLECVLSAPEGMTVGFQKERNQIVPVQEDVPTKKQIDAKEMQTKAIIEGCLNQNINLIRAVIAKWRFKRLMTFPNKQEALTYSLFGFCDDVAGNNLRALCSVEDIEMIRNLNIFKKIKKRWKAECEEEILPYWIYGSISLIPNTRQRTWYRINAILIEAFHCLRRR